MYSQKGYSEHTKRYIDVSEAMWQFMLKDSCIPISDRLIAYRLQYLKINEQKQGSLAWAFTVIQLQKKP